MQARSEDHGSAGHHDLEQALRAMRWTEVPGRFVLLGFPGPPDSADLTDLARVHPAQLVREEGQTTLLLPASHALGARTRHPEARIQEDLVWIRFEAPMAWDLVGFLARVTAELAAAGVPLGVVCSDRRDHLFLAAAHRKTARHVLEGLFGPAQARAR